MTFPSWQPAFTSSDAHGRRQFQRVAAVLSDPKTSSRLCRGYFNATSGALAAFVSLGLGCLALAGCGDHAGEQGFLDFSASNSRGPPSNSKLIRSGIETYNQGDHTETISSNVDTARCGLGVSIAVLNSTIEPV